MKKGFRLICLVAIFLYSSSFQAKASDVDSVSDSRILRSAKMYRYGINTSVNMKRAASMYNHLAQKGNAVAQRELGVMYLNGEGVEQNFKAASNLLKLASSNGDTKAMCHLASMYLHGLGLPVSYKKAYSYYQMAADRNDPKGYYGMGNLVYKGLGVEQDYAMAESLFLKGSEQNQPQCDFMLAVLFAHGFNGTPDYEKAKYYFDKAAKEGHSWTVDVAKYDKLDSIVKANAVSQAKTSKVIARAKSMRKKTVCSSDAIFGEWTGKIYTCDWAKNTILKEEDITVNIVGQDSCLNLIFSRGDTLISNFTSERHIGNKWIKRKILQEDFDYRWVPMDVSLEMGSDKKLYVDLVRWSAPNYAPYKPMKLVLSRKSSTGVKNKMLQNGIRISPIPIRDNFTIGISVKFSEDVKIAMYSLDGMMVGDLGTYSLSAGENQLTLQSKLPKGNYILKMSGKTVNVSKKITHL